MTTSSRPCAASATRSPRWPPRSTLRNPAKFRTGHQKMMDAQESVTRWEHELDQTLASHGLKLKALPDVPIPEPKPDPAPGSAAPTEPALCKTGTATFAADGSVTCETEMLFSPPETAADTPKESIVMCGPGGPLSFGADGVLTGCTLESKLLVGSETLPKRTSVVLGPHGKVTKAVLPDGKGLCFDDEAKSKPCP